MHRAGTSPEQFMAYLTEWTMVVGAIYFTVTPRIIFANIFPQGTFILSLWYFFSKKLSNPIIIITSITWAFHCIQLSLPIIVAILYWTTVYKSG